MNLSEKVILYKFTTRSRPEKFFRCLANIQQYAEHLNYVILCSFDEDDATMNNDSVKERLAAMSVVDNRIVWFYGKSRNKIDAVNRDMDKAPAWDVLINMSDDMRFLVAGFDKIILNDLYEKFPDGDGTVTYYDGGKETRISENEALMTMPIMGRKYFNRFGYIYFPGYDNVWCDNEMMEVAKLLGKYFFSPKTVIVHEHPHNSKEYGEYDDQYRKTEDAHEFHKDRRMFEARQAQGFYLNDEIMLSILICTMPGRENFLATLMRELKEQLYIIRQNPAYVPHWADKLEILTDDTFPMVRGTKRNEMLKKAKGKFIVFIDDDDMVTKNYILLILSAIIKNPTVDCIGMKGWITTNGDNRCDWEISKDFGRWYETESGTKIYYRTPNHISPVRREIAMLGMFPDIHDSEDYEYSMRILPYLKTEFKINEQIYYYDYRSK